VKVEVEVEAEAEVEVQAGEVEKVEVELKRELLQRHATHHKALLHCASWCCWVATNGSSGEFGSRT